MMSFELFCGPDAQVPTGKSIRPRSGERKQRCEQLIVPFSVFFPPFIVFLPTSVQYRTFYSVLHREREQCRVNYKGTDRKILAVLRKFSLEYEHLTANSSSQARRIRWRWQRLFAVTFVGFDAVAKERRSSMRISSIERDPLLSALINIAKF